MPSCGQIEWIGDGGDGGAGGAGEVNSKLYLTYCIFHTERVTERGSAELRQAQLPRSPSKPHAEVPGVVYCLARSAITDQMLRTR
ncbi:MAG: hypothetical protein RH949_25425 [Coleofasciculus sp. A1-SPW-01]|uniref:hypothetical protein n=1 Tax=Coleofasciculus sp. A1-SPW-01 TaxID=3070819 RepID=UPI003300B8A9